LPFKFNLQRYNVASTQVVPNAALRMMLARLAAEKAGKQQQRRAGAGAGSGHEEAPSRSAVAGGADSSGALAIDRRCAECGVQSANCKMCSGCKRAWYCSGACQKTAWKAHKVACKAAAASEVPEPVAL
jgi:hypothetical protein